MLLKHVPETLLESNSVCMHPQPHDPEPFDIAGKFAPAGSSTCTTCAVGTYKGCGTSGIRGESVLLASEDHLPRLRPGKALERTSATRLYHDCQWHQTEVCLGAVNIKALSTTPLLPPSEI